MTSAQDRTEQATPRRREKARQEGQVSRSTDFNSAFVLTLAVGSLVIFGNHMVTQLYTTMDQAFSDGSFNNFNSDNIGAEIIALITKILLMLTPFCSLLCFTAIISNFIQIGWIFTTKPLSPKISKLNPINGIKRIFSLKSFVELIKSLLKMIVIAVAAYITINAHFDTLINLANTDIYTLIKVIGDITLILSVEICCILIFLGIIDVFYQRYEYSKTLRMTKQEIKDERKNIEGDPLIKSKIRGIQMQMARKRMMKDVEGASVVVTNPTHIAIALKYDPKKSVAPKIVAKGAGYIAEKIKDIAKKHKVPVVENKPLARTMYKSLKVGDIIPKELYVAVAEILAFIYKKNQSIKGSI